MFLNNDMILLAGSLLVSACGATAPSVTQNAAMAIENNDRADEGDLANKSVREGATVVLATYRAGPLSMTARNQGILALKGHCLIITHVGGSEFEVPVFPRGKASWDDATQTLIFRGKSYRIGDKIDLGGGSVKRGSEIMPAIEGLPDDCPSEYVWLVG